MSVGRRDDPHPYRQVIAAPPRPLPRRDYGLWVIGAVVAAASCLGALLGWYL